MAENEDSTLLQVATRGQYMWLKSLNIAVGSEQKQRSLAKGIVGDNMAAEMGAFMKEGGEEIQEVPFAYVPHLIRKATDLIEKHRK